MGEMADLIAVIIRSLLSLFTLFLVAKMLGKKQVSQLSVFDYVVGISIGNFAAEMTINLESHWMHGTIAVIVYGVVAYLISLGTMKSIWLRRIFMSTPTIMIQDGKLLEKNMKKAKFDINDLLEECRSNGYFDLNEISYAVLESNGKLSILPKETYRPLTPKDMNLSPDKSSLVANLVIDGKIMKKHLEIVNKKEDWLIQQLSVKGYKSLDKVLLATLDNKDKLTIYEKNETIKAQDVFE
ncbi:MAG: DUF421 domain-containing protein [Bacilli bacterium]